MNTREIFLVGFIVMILIINGHCLYGRKYKAYHNPREKCTKNDPIAQPNVNLDKISGVLWHSIRQTATNETGNSDVTFRWFAGSDTVLVTERRGRDPGYCTSYIFPSKKIPGRNAYEIFGVTEGIEEYRILHHSREYVMSWLCVEFDKERNCLNSVISLLRNKPELDLSSADLAYLDRIVYQATCELTVSRDFVRRRVLRKACPDVRLPGNDPLCQY